MTEEHLEEIWQTWRVGTSSIKDLIRAVVAEARNEAIDEMRDELEKCWGYRSNIKTITLNQMYEIAARLKEQGRV